MCLEMVQPGEREKVRLHVKNSVVYNVEDMEARLEEF